MSAFPAWLVPEWDSAADVFCAAFGGRNTTVHLTSMPRVALVDNDQEKLEAMSWAVPDGWTAHCEDAYGWAERQEQLAFDAVILDPWTNESVRVMARLELFARLARKHLVVGTTWRETWGEDRRAAALAPDWHELDIVYRSDFEGGVYWLVLEREEQAA